MDKKSKSSQKASKIIEAALNVFGEKGYYNATISDIARKAGVAEGTIYEYFGSKEDLLFAIPGEITDTAVDLYESIYPYITSAEDKIRGIIRAYYTLYKGNPEYSSLVLLDIKHNRKFKESESYKAVRRATDLMLRAIREGIDSGEFLKDLDPYMVRSMILGTIEHIFFRWHLGGRTPDLNDFSDEMTELMMRGIKRKEDSAVYHFNISIDAASLSPGTAGHEAGKDEE